MRILFIGDMHLKISRFNESVELLRWVDSVIRDTSPDLVVNLGDTFDTHAVLRSEILHEFIEHVKRNSHVRYVYVLGNHDMFKPNDSTYHALRPFKKLIKNLTVVDEPLHDKQLGISFVPYIHDHSEFPLNTERICVAHQTFIGADYGYYRPDVGVDADKLASDIVVSGHVHKRQSFGKVVYPGTPVAVDMNDVDQQKGLMLLNSDTYEYSFIESPFPLIRSLRFDLAEQDVESVLEEMSSTVSGKDRWVMYIRGKRKDVGKVTSSAIWEQLSSNNVSLRPEYTDTHKVDKRSIEARDLYQAVSTYVDDVYVSSVDKGALKSLFKQLIEKINENNFK